MACHKTRYIKKEFINKLELAGFEVEYSTSYMFTLIIVN
jgi:hypothetical protein